MFLPTPVICHSQNQWHAKLVDLAEKYFVKGPELWESSRLIYSSVLADTVAEHEANTEDLGRLVMLKWTLGLSSQEVASCHHKVRLCSLLSFLSLRPSCSCLRVGVAAASFVSAVMTGCVAEGAYGSFSILLTKETNR